MSLSADGIKGMLDEYEKDRHTGMDTALIAQEIYNFTNGYPFLVSRICLQMDTQLVGDCFADLSAVWTRAGVSESVRRILTEKIRFLIRSWGKCTITRR